MDIVERLHSHPEFAFEPPIGCLDLMDEAADEIERLREENKDLKSALMNVLFSEASHVKVTKFTKEKE